MKEQKQPSEPEEHDGDKKDCWGHYNRGSAKCQACHDRYRCWVESDYVIPKAEEIEIEEKPKPKGRK